MRKKSDAVGWVALSYIHKKERDIQVYKRERQKTHAVDLRFFFSVAFDGRVKLIFETTWSSAPEPWSNVLNSSSPAACPWGWAASDFCCWRKIEGPSDGEGVVDDSGRNNLDAVEMLVTSAQTNAERYHTFVSKSLHLLSARKPP
jgi:hypothetical protein